jgi:hypothetical protein
MDARGAGRTTALVNEATMAYKAGVHVLIIAHTHAFARDIAGMVAKNGDRGVSFDGWDTAYRRLFGSGFVPFIDHHALETGRPNPELWERLAMFDGKEWTRVSRLSPMAAACDADVSLRAVSSGPGTVIARAYVDRCEQGCWRLDDATAAVIGDKLELIGRPWEASTFRSALGIGGTLTW